MSADAPDAPFPTPTPKPSFGAIAVDVLKLALGIASGPAGILGVATLLGPEHPVLNTIVQFGIRALGKIVPSLTEPEVTDEQLANEIDRQGGTTEPYDPLEPFHTAAIEKAKKKRK